MKLKMQRKGKAIQKRKKCKKAIDENNNNP